jgi:hypothetical protein
MKKKQCLVVNYVCKEDEDDRNNFSARDYLGVTIPLYI